jgi:hypothetical protein
MTLQRFSRAAAAGAAALIFSSFTTPAHSPLTTDVRLGRDASEARVVVLKPEGRSAQLLLKDAQNRLLLDCLLEERQVKTELDLRLSTLPEGTYRLKVTDAQTVNVKEITIREIPDTDFGPERIISVKLIE